MSLFSHNNIQVHVNLFLKYALVGGLGTVIDLGTVFLLVQFFGVHYLFASTVGFFLAVTNNFFLNKFWTFSNNSTNYRKLWIKFFLVSSVGLGITLLLMFLLVDVLHIPLLFQGVTIGILFAKALTSGVVLVWNFLANTMWTFREKKRTLHILSDFPVELSIILPSYNEAKRLPRTLHKISAFLEREKIDAEVIVVDDGSSDGTRNIVKQQMKVLPFLKLLRQEKNKGKGAAVAKGVDAAEGKYILLSDADGSTPIEEYTRLQSAGEKHDVVIGSRYLEGSVIDQKQGKFRIFIGRFGNSIIRFFLIDGIMDTQCGFKLFRHAVAKEIFSRQKVRRFGFDIEALVIAKSFGYRIMEIPVHWSNSPDSRFRPLRDAVRTFFDLLYIKVNLWTGRYR